MEAENKGERTPLSDGSNAGCCFGFDGITLGVLKSTHSTTFPRLQPNRGAAVICSVPGVISFICGGPATEICCSSLPPRPHLQIRSRLA